MYMAIFTHTFCPIAPTKNSNKKGHFPHEIHAKNVLFTYSHQPDSLEMYFSNQPDNLYYHLSIRFAYSYYSTTENGFGILLSFRFISASVHSSTSTSLSSFAATSLTSIGSRTPPNTSPTSAYL